MINSKGMVLAMSKYNSNLLSVFDGKYLNQKTDEKYRIIKDTT